MMTCSNPCNPKNCDLFHGIDSTAARRALGRRAPRHRGCPRPLCNRSLFICHQGNMRAPLRSQFSKFSVMILIGSSFQSPPQKYFSFWSCAIHSVICKGSVPSININDSYFKSWLSLLKILMLWIFNVGTKDKILEHSHFCMIAKSWRRQIRRCREITN